MNKVRARAKALLRDGVAPAEVATRLRVPQSLVDRWARQLEASSSLRTEVEFRLFLAGLMVPAAFALLLTTVGRWGWLVVIGWPILYLVAWAAYLFRTASGERHR